MLIQRKQLFVSLYAFHNDYILLVAVHELIGYIESYKSDNISFVC